MFYGLFLAINPFEMVEPFFNLIVIIAWSNHELEVIH